MNDVHSDPDPDYRDLEDRLRHGAPDDQHDEQHDDPVDAVTRRFREAAAQADLADVAYAMVDSPVGQLIVAATATGIVGLGWEADVVLGIISARVSPRVLALPSRLDGARRQLDEYFAGRRITFDLPIDWALSNGFRRSVLHELVNVPFGEIVTYAGLAARVGNPNASRAVGSAMATNPIPIIVPCHRVLRTGGALGGYSGRDGLVTKRFLLEHEGVDLPAAARR